MSLECGRKPEYPEKTHAATGRTCQLHTDRPAPAVHKPRIFLQRGNSANPCTTVPSLTQNYRWMKSPDFKSVWLNLVSWFRLWMWRLAGLLTNKTNSSLTKTIDLTSILCPWLEICIGIGILWDPTQMSQEQSVLTLLTKNKQQVLRLPANKSFHSVNVFPPINKLVTALVIPSRLGLLQQEMLTICRVLVPAGMHFFINITHCFPCRTGKAQIEWNSNVREWMVRLFEGVGGNGQKWSRINKTVPRRALPLNSAVGNVLTSLTLNLPPN